MATIVSTKCSPHVQDPGYVSIVDLYDDGSFQEYLAPVAATTVSANFNTLITKLRAALTANQTYINTTNPSTAVNTAHIKALTLQMDAVIYLCLHELTGLASIPGT